MARRRNTTIVATTPRLLRKFRKQFLLDIELVERGRLPPVG
jgi:hypothetical protein